MERISFDEELTGLEDIAMAEEVLAAGKVVEYVPGARVYHLHNETWPQVRRRFEREAIAMQSIKPNLHISWLDKWRFFLLSVFGDLIAAIKHGAFWDNTRDIVLYRWNQYQGIYAGGKPNRTLSALEREKYFFPTYKSVSSRQRGLPE